MKPVPHPTSSLQRNVLRWILVILFGMQNFTFSRLNAQLADASSGKEFAEDVPRLINAMAEFSFRLITLGGETSSLSRDERWKKVFGQLDQIYEQPAGTCEKRLPRLARDLLGKPCEQPPEFVAVAYLVTQSVKNAEKAVLEAVAKAPDKKAKYHALLVAVACAVEQGDIEIALERLDADHRRR